MQNYPLRIQETSRGPINNDRLKLAGLGHCRLMSEIHKASFSHGWEERDISDYIRHHYCYGLIYDNSAFIIFRTIGEDCEIITLAVKPELRRKGIAEQLCQEAIGICQGLKLNKIFIEVSEKNNAAINLYKKLNFTQHSTRKDYYTKNEDGIMMNLSL